jgi:GTP-binding protein EngB required for normal cell division
VTQLSSELEDQAYDLKDALAKVDKLKQDLENEKILKSHTNDNHVPVKEEVCQQTISNPIETNKGRSQWRRKRDHRGIEARVKECKCKDTKTR